MRITEYIQCIDFPCEEARQESYLVPDIELDPDTIRLVLISETAPNDPVDAYYGPSDALFARTTLQAFQEAGLKVSNTQDLLLVGIYLTTAVKCGKYDYTVATSTIIRCSSLLEREIPLFPNVKAYLLMGDVAIKALNAIAKRQGLPRVIPAGSTYKIRGGEFTYRGRRVFPSYLQAGPSYGIEKSKQRMIAEDIASALRVAGLF
jgi:uracil-DNA glycosylase